MMKNILVYFLVGFACMNAIIGQENEVEPIDVDVCVYGGTAAGVIAAIQSAKLGHNVVIIEPGRHIGGIAVDGLGGTDVNNHRDFKNSSAIGGMALDFYKKIAVHYNRKDWLSNNENSSTWRFESKVADSIYDAWVSEYDIPVYYESEIIFKPRAVVKIGNRINEIRMSNGLIVKAKFFIDASIEGDLMHYAGVSTIVGREGNNVYDETKNGIRRDSPHQQFTVNLDPYVIPGNPQSGLIPTILNEDLGTPGEGDNRIQAYCFRVCMTQNQKNKVDFVKPSGYDPNAYEIYLRYIKAGQELHMPQANLPNDKTDWNGGRALSHNLNGMNHDYPSGDKDTRLRILREHEIFTKGLLYFLSNDERVPSEIREQWKTWGLCKDEFIDNNNWPRNFYVRDARRMVSDYVITEHHTSKTNQTFVEDPVGIAYWPPDVHATRRIVRNGYAYNEGFVFGGDDWLPFGISYRSLVPKKSEAINLITPTCPSSSHIGYGAIRLEWTFMILGQSSALAVDIALRHNSTIQEVPYAELKKTLLDNHQIINVEKVKH